MISHKTHPLLYETIWFDKCKYDEAEKQFQESKAKKQKVPEKSNLVLATSLVDEIASARERIKNTLKEVETSSFSPSENLLEMKSKIEFLMEENQKLQNSLLTVVEALVDMKQLKEDYAKLRADLENFKKNPLKILQDLEAEEEAADEAKMKIECNGDDDDDIDLFGSDEEDEQTVKLREERLKAYENKKAKKAPVQAKSLVVLDVKPWNDETDLKEMEKHVREVQADGLSWKASKLVPVAYGIKALQIAAVVEDEKVSIDWLQETLQEIEDYVQSVDIAAFNKL